MSSYQTFIEQKAKQKRELLGKMFFPRTPVLLVHLNGGRPTVKGIKKEELLKECKGLLLGLETIQLTTLVVCPDSMVKELPQGKYLHFLDPQKFDTACAAADFVIDFHTDPTHIRKFGCVPVAQQNGASTVDYNPIQEEGDGFYFVAPNQWEMFDAIVRARETYKFPYDWENLIKSLS
ncbi:hypothetical protein COV82_06000 [Candidatus Peregrinibacteria bacterium CG11_big_fil_rev_8_21_14_0_20_46_8]|nr:MAG: hypothetical protein COV82_06000 [Candidatus Peregrinibacteria bacterium CG11_big_fil_rev_8_21_14_0_20_46_8]